MKRKIAPALFAIALVCAVSTVEAAPVEYVRICSLYGAGFYYLPGTDTCFKPENGDTRHQTAAGTWRSLLPYPEGRWTTSLQGECSPGKAVTLGTFKSTDFTFSDLWVKSFTAPIPLKLKSNEFVSKVIMHGGFYDPRVDPVRQGTNTGAGLCLRSIDLENFEASLEEQEECLCEGEPDCECDCDCGGEPDCECALEKYIFGNGGLPIGCISRSRFAQMPAAYSITSTAPYPSVSFRQWSNDPQDSEPFPFASHVIVSTDLPSGGPNKLVYYVPQEPENEEDPPVYLEYPLAGKVAVHVCVQAGLPGLGNIP